MVIKKGTILSSPSYDAIIMAIGPDMVKLAILNLTGQVIRHDYFRLNLLKEYFKVSNKLRSIA